MINDYCYFLWNIITNEWLCFDQILCFGLSGFQIFLKLALLVGITKNSTLGLTLGYVRRIKPGVWVTNILLCLFSLGLTKTKVLINSCLFSLGLTKTKVLINLGLKILWFSVLLKCLRRFVFARIKLHNYKVIKSLNKIYFNKLDFDFWLWIDLKAGCLLYKLDCSYSP